MRKPLLILALAVAFTTASQFSSSGLTKRALGHFPYSYGPYSFGYSSPRIYSAPGVVVVPYSTRGYLGYRSTYPYSYRTYRTYPRYGGYPAGSTIVAPQTQMGQLPSVHRRGIGYDAGYGASLRSGKPVGF